MRPGAERRRHRPRRRVAARLPFRRLRGRLRGGSGRGHGGCLRCRAAVGSGRPTRACRGLVRRRSGEELRRGLPGGGPRLHRGAASGTQRRGRQLGGGPRPPRRRGRRHRCSALSHCMGLGRRCAQLVRGSLPPLRQLALAVHLRLRCKAQGWPPAEAPPVLLPRRRGLSHGLSKHAEAAPEQCADLFILIAIRLLLMPST
mmetsp:Transcript_131722/g.367204  ORF Transcript_131722/g.367204 Transcript_131722/m.367204 type:complete len:201 (+) Transcript_131722:1167-1769(+)